MDRTGLVASVLLIGSVACGFMYDDPPPIPIEDPPVEVAHVVPDAQRPESIVGTWRMIPDERRLRELKIIDAAVSGKEVKRARLGDLTPQEQALFDGWVGKKGKEVAQKEKELEHLRSYLIEVTPAEITLRFGEEVFGPVPYTTVSETPTNVTLAFDPGLGNGVETHSWEFTSATRALDRVTTPDGDHFDPIEIVRIREPEGIKESERTHRADGSTAH